MFVCTVVRKKTKGLRETRLTQINEQHSNIHELNRYVSIKDMHYNI